MKTSVQRILAFLISGSLILSTPVGAAPPEPVGPSILPTDFSKELAAAENYHRQYADLEKAGEGQPKSALAPDRFLLMEQTTYPKQIPVVRSFMGRFFRKWNLRTMISRTDKYLTALAVGTQKSEPFAKVLSTEEIKAAALDHVNTGRRVDVPQFLWDRRHDRAQLETIKAALGEVQATWNWKAEKNIDDNPTESPLATKTRAINWWEVTVQVQEEGRQVKNLRMSDTAGGTNTRADQPYFCSEKTCTFNLVKNKAALNVFGIQAQVVGTFDQFLVFTHADSYDAVTGTQYLSFLDLGTYNGLLGNEAIPVFRLPLKIDEPIQTLSLQDGRLVLNGKFYIERSYFEQASEMQQVAFNLQANLISPESWAKVLPLVDSVQEFFGKSIDQEIKSKMDERKGLREAAVLMKQLGKELQDQLDRQKLMKPMTKDEHNQLGQKMVAGSGQTEKASAESLALYHKRVSDSAQLAEIMKQTQGRARVSRQLSTRVKMLANALVAPQPHASQKIKEALGQWFIRRAGTGSTMDRLVKLVTDRPYVNAGVVSAAILAAVAPETFGQMVDTGLSYSNAIVDYVTSAMKGLGGATLEGSKATFSTFYDPIQSISRTYIDNGAWWRTGVGISAFAGFLGALYFVPHFLFNFSALVKDLKKPGVNGFVDRQNKFRDEYFARLAKDEGEKRDFGKVVEFTPEEETEIQAFLRQRKAEVEGRRFFGFAGKQPATETEITTEASAQDQTEQLENAVQAADQSTAIAKATNDSPEDFQNFWQAAKHFAFSMPALELTLERWAGIWNWWAGWRFSTFGFSYVRVLGSDIPWAIKVKPLAFSTRIIYPEFLSTAIFKDQYKTVIPSEVNGGLKTRCSSIYQKACALLDIKTSSGVSTKKQMQALRAFEEQVVKAEEEITEVAFRAALEQLPKFMTNKEDLKQLFSSKSLDTITQQDIKNLSWASKTFLRAYFESVYQAGMAKFLSATLSERQAAEDQATELAVQPAVAGAEPSEVDVEQENTQRSVKAIKESLITIQAANGSEANYAFDIEKAKSAALAVADDAQHYKNAQAAVKKGKLNWSNFSMNNKYNLVSDFDPRQNRSTKRMAVVDTRLKSPGALGRALRAEISKLKLTLPIDLTFKLLLSAGVYEGAMKPIQDEMWGPNSTFYLSHTSFYMIMASGFFMSIMADAWLKLQMDARQDDAGEFGMIPQGEDAQKSFLRWYKKQFSASENSLLKGWAEMNAISFWNMPAAIPNILLFYFMFSGRIDLSLLMAGYAVAFGTPVQALEYKVDQAFERAAHFAARGVKDEKWLAHPDVQKFLVPEMQRMRDRFTLFKDIYRNFEGNWLGNIEMIPTDLGPRGMQRALFGGGLLEEYIVNYAISPLQKAVAGVPVLENVVTPILNGCEYLLTNGNTDLRLKK